MIISIVTAVGLLAVAGGVFVLLNASTGQVVISKQILSEANFTIFYPNIANKTASNWQFEKDLTTYDTSSGVLTLHALQASSGKRIVLNEQPVPGAFTDVPTQYSRMLTTLNEYNELQIGFGTVALTHPKELNGGQTAVANKAGTLIFAKPSADLTDDEWSNFFGSLRIVR
jgi:hypothetical protein